MKENQLIVLKNEHLEVLITTYGASIYDIKYNKNGHFQSVLSTSRDVETFLKDDLNKGRLIGRTAGKTFYEVVKNDAHYHEVVADFSHGGKSGYNKQYFHIIEKNEREVLLGHQELESDSFYQGDFEFTVRYQLVDESLKVIFNGHSTKDTYVNLTSHPYFNLSGEKDILNHQLMVPSSSHTRRSASHMLGETVEVIKDHDDFREERALKDTLVHCKLDHVYHVNNDSLQTTLKAGGIMLSVYSSYPGIVIFSQNRDSIYPLSNNDSLNNIHGGLAIEPQYIQAQVPRLKKGELYHHYITYRFSRL